MGNLQDACPYNVRAKSDEEFQHGTQGFARSA